MSGLPAELRGAWERVGFTVSGRPVDTPARVLWVQAAHGFADLRIPVGDDRLECFAGTTSFDGRSLTWRHTFDLAGWEGADTGVVSWRGDDLVETGEMVVDGRVQPYEEVWRRVDPGAGLLVLDGRLADGTPAGLLVASGDRAITLVDHRPDGSFSAASWSQRGGRWVADDLVGGRAATLPTPPDDVPAIGAEVGLTPTGGCASWAVVEHERPA